MFGIENISAHNGWAISIIGITIVFTGLTTLSIIISQLHKALDFWENKRKFWPARNRHREAESFSPSEISLPPYTRESARQYKMIVDRLGEPFSLPQLLSDAQRCGLDHPHSTINELIRSEIIVPDGTGYYQWNLN